MTTQTPASFAEYEYLSPEDRERIETAWSYVISRTQDITRESGEQFIEHPLRVAKILASHRLDADAIICALLHGTIEQLGIPNEEVITQFGKSVASLISGTSRISNIKLQNKSESQAESIRKMFFAMVDDIRIILIRLADRLDKMRNLKQLPDDQKKIIAQETIDIWAPLANRLGISSIKDELEDLSLKYLNREAFDQIKALVAAKKGERAGFLEKAENAIQQAARDAGFHISVHSRAKHFWSIYQKIKKRSKSSDELFDLLAMRILCSTPNECYAVLGLVHTIWKPLDGRFKDYVAMPKPNGYQSLHTTVMCYEGRPLEIQIRTNEMHNVAENGIASHWAYKHGASRSNDRSGQISIINQLKELTLDRSSDDEFLAHIKSDILGDSIYIFTPKGDIIELPSGSTAIDFAYHVHTAIGEKIVAAKSDGVIIPLSQPLQNTQVIEVTTHPQAHPTLNQYNSVRTAKARQKIRAWLQEHDPSSGFDKKDETGNEKPPTIRSTIQRPLKPEEEGELPGPEFDTAILKIRIGDTTNFLIKFANCCKPLPPHAITGYVSRGRGIIIHRTDCSNLSRIPDIRFRSIPVEWDRPSEDKLTPKKKK